MKVIVLLRSQVVERGFCSSVRHNFVVTDKIPGIYLALNNEAFIVILVPVDVLGVGSCGGVVG